MKRLGALVLVVLAPAACALAACSQDGTVVPASSSAGGDAGQGAETAPGADAGATADTGASVDASGEASGGDAAADAPAEVGPSTLYSLVVSTGALVPAFNPSVTAYDVLSINALHPLQVTATTTDPAARLTIHGAAATSGVPATTSLSPGEDLDVTVQPTGGGAPRTYRVSYVPSDMPVWTVTGSAAAGVEPVLFSLLSPALRTGNYALMVDRSGAPLYYRRHPGEGIENFQRVTLPGGDVRYTYHVGKGTDGWSLGAEHVMDEQLHDLADYQLLPHASHGVLPAEGHDFLLLGPGHYVVMTYAQRTVDLSQLDPAWSAQALVMNPVVQEVQNGTVLLEWDSADVPSLYAASVDDNAFGATDVSDYLHLNSIDVDPADGNILLSFRHANSVVKLDRHTGQILWTLGGVGDQFGLTAEQVFSHQHHARMHPDGSLTIFDNGNGLHQTRVIRFVLDEAHHTVTSFEVIAERPPGDPPTFFMGSATPLPSGNTFIGWGGWNSTAVAPGAVEVDPGGNVVWTLQFESTFFSYRALLGGT